MDFFIELGLFHMLELWHKKGLPRFSRKRIATTQTQNITRQTFWYATSQLYLLVRCEIKNKYEIKTLLSLICIFTVFRLHGVCTAISMQRRGFRQAVCQRSIPALC